MSIISLDIGTTSICGILLKGSFAKPTRMEKRSNTFMDRKFFSQNPAKILSLCLQILEALWEPEVTDIAISSQMHGILFTDAFGQPVTDFYTWKNPWGYEPKGNTNFADFVSSVTNRKVLSGHGLVTALYLAEHGMIPKSAAYVCNIGDDIAMVLSGTKRPILNITIAESIGGVDLQTGTFDRHKLEMLGLPPALFPEVSKTDVVLGEWKNARIHAALGDNQCSFLGSVGDYHNGVCINVGTGQQVSCFYPVYLPAERVEIRSFFDLGYLYVGVSQNGGKVYERFVQMMESIVQNLTGMEIDGYAVCQKLWECKPGRTELYITPALYSNIGKVQRGSVLLSGIDETQGASDLLDAYVAGMAQELYTLYCDIPDEIRQTKTQFYAAGNGITKNRILWQLTEHILGRKLLGGEIEEAAAIGAAIYIRGGKNESDCRY